MEAEANMRAGQDLCSQIHFIDEDIPPPGEVLTCLSSRTYKMRNRTQGFLVQELSPKLTTAWCELENYLPKLK